MIHIETELQILAIVAGNDLLLDIDDYTPEDFEDLIFRKVSLWYADCLVEYDFIPSYDEEWVRSRMAFIIEDRAWETMQGDEQDEYFLNAGFQFLEDFHAEYGLNDLEIDRLFIRQTMKEAMEELISA